MSTMVDMVDMDQHGCGDDEDYGYGDYDDDYGDDHNRPKIYYGCHYHHVGTRCDLHNHYSYSPNDTHTQYIDTTTFYF